MAEFGHRPNSYYLHSDHQGFPKVVSHLPCESGDSLRANGAMSSLTTDPFVLAPHDKNLQDGMSAKDETTNFNVDLGTNASAHDPINVNTSGFGPSSHHLRSDFANLSSSYAYKWRNTTCWFRSRCETIWFHIFQLSILWWDPILKSLVGPTYHKLHTSWNHSFSRRPQIARVCHCTHHALCVLYTSGIWCTRVDCGPELMLNLHRMLLNRHHTVQPSWRGARSKELHLKNTKNWCGCRPYSLTGPSCRIG